MKLKIPYFQWRDGRPRWEPGPALRARGCRGQDLKDECGRFLPLGAAVERAKELNLGAAALGTKARSEAPVARTMANLFRAYQDHAHFAKLAPRTQRSYRAHIVLLARWCGDAPLHAVTRGAIETFHAALESERGLATANAVMRTLKLVLYFAQTKLEWTDRNRAARLDMPAPAGRLVLWTPEEIGAFVAWADALGLEAQGDALILGLLTGQRQGDILRLPEGEIGQGHYVIAQQKTGARAFVPLTKPLVARLEAMRARKKARWPNVLFRHELVNGRGLPYGIERSLFGDEFRTVRALAAGAGAAMVQIAAGAFGYTELSRPSPVYDLPVQPSILTKRYADLRDTAVTWLFAAGCSVAEIATITGHSLKTVQAILDRHYFVRHEQMALAAGAKLDAWISNSGMKL